MPRPPPFAALVAGRLLALDLAGRRVLHTAALLDADPDSDLVPVVAEVDRDTWSRPASGRRRLRAIRLDPAGGGRGT